MPRRHSRQYKEYGIEQEPFVIVKADAGTYGMGIMTVKDPKQVRNLNHEQRKHLAVVKGHSRCMTCSCRKASTPSSQSSTPRPSRSST